MEFFHCMRCAHWPTFQPDNRVRYFFTSCGRLICQNCANFLNNKCMCQSESCKLMEIKQQAKELKSFFMDPMSLVQDAMKKPLQILQFQSSLQKNCIRIVGKLVESSKSLKNEVSSLKSEVGSLKLENEHLRKTNERLTQQHEQLKSNMNNGFPHSQVNSATFLGNSPGSGNHRLGQVNSQNDPLNLFREERPNAQVSPNMHLQQQSAAPTSSFPGNRMSSFVAPPISPSPSLQNQNSLFSQLSGFSRPFSIPRSSNASPASFGTPQSFISAGGSTQSPYFQQQPASERTPDLINRLRFLQCKATPNNFQN